MIQHVKKLQATHESPVTHLFPCFIFTLLSAYSSSARGMSPLVLQKCLPWAARIGSAQRSRLRCAQQVWIPAAISF